MDLILRGATIADGSGGPLRNADVLVRDGLIVTVGDVAPDADAETIDLTGCVLAPGFIDAHTHYDAQVLWDADLTPTCWHGVTTVLTGNCGFGIAPIRPEQRTLIADTLENVEGMEATVLAAGIPWTFETYPEYLDAVSARPLRINIATLIGHTPVRLFVMGDAASEREATSAEIEAMRALVVQGLEHGAFGFSTSRSPNHNGAQGRPVPSRFAGQDEMQRLIGVLGEVGEGILQVTPGPSLGPVELAQFSKDTGRPAMWTAMFTGLGSDLLTAAGEPGTVAELMERTRQLGGTVYPQIANLPQIMQVTLADPFPFGMMPSFEQVLASPREARVAIYRNQQWVERARSELSARWDGRWAKTTIDESVVHEALRHGPTLAELAAERGVHPFDLMIRLSVEDDLRTRFRCVLGNDDEGELHTLLLDHDTMLAVSDGGAHVSQICDARYPTHLLRYWVREKGTLSIEEAVWRLAGQPAEILGLTTRGMIAEGKVADLVAFDPQTVAEMDPVRVWDLPASGDRLLAGAVGIVAVWVAGEMVVRNGELVDGAAPGALLRRGQP